VKQELSQIAKTSVIIHVHTDFKNTFLFQKFHLILNVFSLKDNCSR